MGAAKKISVAHSYKKVSNEYFTDALQYIIHLVQKSQKDTFNHRHLYLQDIVQFLS